VKRKLVRGVVIAAGVCAALFVARRIVFPLPLDRCHTRRFSTELWQDSSQAFSRAAFRGCMVDHLLRRTELRGVTRDSVVRLLGPGDNTAYFREYDLVYWLGPERGLMSIDSEWLVIRLDDRSRVAEAKVVTD
jgi:hypothetical protein